MPMFENFTQDANGNVSIVGSGVAGTPSGGVVSIQGETGMTPILSTGTGTAGTPASGVSTIQGISGGTPVSVIEASSSTATLTTVAASASSVSLLASNSNRKGFLLYNNSTKIVNVAFAATASNTAFTVQMAAMSLFESQSLYTGAISGIWSMASGSMQVTELT